MSSLQNTPRVDPTQVWVLDKIGTRYQQLDKNAKDLVTMMVVLGAASIPRIVLFRALSGTLHWNTEGEIDYGTKLELNVFKDNETLNAALEALMEFGLVKESAIEEPSIEGLSSAKSPGSLSAFNVSPCLHAYMSSDSTALKQWKVDALRLVVYTFPRSIATEPV